MNTLIAIPSAQPGGLEAPLGAHFGHCDLYTLVAVENGKVKDVHVVPNVPHYMRFSVNAAVIAVKF